MNDPTETIRRARLAEINIEPNPRAALEARYGQVWDTSELSEDFEALGFMAPLVVVRRRSRREEGVARVSTFAEVLFQLYAT